MPFQMAFLSVLEQGQNRKKNNKKKRIEPNSTKTAFN